MNLESFWKYLRLLVLSGAVAFAAVAAPSVAPFSSAPFSSAPVAVADDDEEEEEEDDDDGDQDDEAQGRVVNGQVLGIYEPGRGWRKPEGVSFDETTPADKVALRVFQTGNQVVHVVLYNPNQIGEQGLKLGDHVSVDGEFIGGTFYGDYFEVTDSCC